MSETQYTCTVIQDDTKIYRSTLTGIKPLVYWLREQPQILKGSYVIDKIVGKASALLLIYDQAGRVHGLTMSKAAVAVLTAHNIPFSYDTLTDFIENRDKTGMCPMEQKVVDVDDPQKAFAIFDEIIK